MIATAMQDEKKALPKGWQWVKLGDVCELNPRRPFLVRDENSRTTFVQMSSVDEVQGIIQTVEQRPYSEVKKGYTYFGEGDVLFAKITPCMQNGKHAIARNLIDGIGFGSTEFHVIRPGPKIIAEWVYLFIRQPVVLHAAERTFTGAVGQQRVPDSFLANLEIPLPPLAEQKRITKILNEKMSAIEEARIAADEQLKAADFLASAYLREEFPEPGSELPKGWGMGEAWRCVRTHRLWFHCKRKTFNKRAEIFKDHGHSEWSSKLGHCPRVRN